LIKNCFREIIHDHHDSVITYFKKNKNSFLIYFFLLLAGLMYGRHQFNGQFNWRISIFADAGGYYVYQPALFLHHFKEAEFPENISEKVGKGFYFDSNQKLINKYPIGVAILQSPFFLLCHGIATISGLPVDGFSGIYHHVPDVASLFYTFFGLIFFFGFLRNFFSYGIALMTVFLTFMGTNLFFYSMDYTGMSHIYSFFVFSAFVYVLFKKSPFQQKLSFIRLFVLLSLSSIMLVLRPTNLIFLVFSIVLNYYYQKKNIRKLFINLTPKLFILGFLAGILFIFPQLLYWKYAYGQWVKYSYTGESFSNLDNPQIFKLLFSSDNGLIPHSPLVLFAIIGIVFMLLRKEIAGYIIAVLFALIVYLFSSWHIVNFGCGFGSRNFVEYYVLIAIGLGYLLSKLNTLKTQLRNVLIAGIVLFTLIGQQLMSNADKCGFNPAWDYFRQRQQLFEFRDKKTFLLKNEQHFTAKKEFSKSFKVVQQKYTIENWRHIFVKARLYSEEKPTGVAVCCELKDGDSTIYWFGSNLAEIREIKTGIYEIYMNPMLPPHTETKHNLYFYMWNSKKENFRLKKIHVLLF